MKTYKAKKIRGKKQFSLEKEVCEEKIEVKVLNCNII